MEQTAAAHSNTTILISCTINPDLLGEWDELSEEARDMWKTHIHQSISCGGDGDLGLHCGGCRFVKLEDVFND